MQIEASDPPVQSIPWHQMPRVLTVTTDIPDPCTVWRAWWPAGELVARGHAVDYVKYGDLNLAMPVLEYGRWNVVNTPRMGFLSLEAEQAWFDQIDRLRRDYGIVWAYDIDDDLITPGFVTRQLEIGDMGLGPGKAARMYEFTRASRVRLLARADLVTVASHELGQLVRQYTNAAIEYVPNGINLPVFLHAVGSRPREVPPVTVGWSGGPRLSADMEPIATVWPQLASEFPDVQFVIQGWCPDDLPACMPEGRLVIRGGKPIEQYPSELGNIDVFCCFAGSDPWLRNKTPIKWIEASLAGAACVVSTNLYGPAINVPVEGLEAGTPDEWLAALRLLVSDPLRRQKMNSAAVKTIISRHTLQQSYVFWLRAWANGLHN